MDQGENPKPKSDTWEIKAGEYLDGWKRERAAFENYKKDEYERINEVRLRAIRDFLTRLVPILDSFELALKSTPEEAQKSDWFKGYTYIKKQFEDFLKEEGIEEIETKGKEFDPRLHEAIEHVEPQEGQGGQGKLMVAEEMQKGYKLNDYIIRPARVRVGKKVESPPSP